VSMASKSANRTEKRKIWPAIKEEQEGAVSTSSTLEQELDHFQSAFCSCIMQCSHAGLCLRGVDCSSGKARSVTVQEHLHTLRSASEITCHMLMWDCVARCTLMYPLLATLTQLGGARLYFQLGGACTFAR
jgi:hypothetical protein